LLMILTTLVGFLFIAISIPLVRRRIPPNGIYGLRVPATFADESVWYEANAKSGRDLLCLGVLLAVLAVTLPGIGIGASAYIGWAVIAGIGAVALGIVGWVRANRLLRKRQQANHPQAPQT
jgi:hypothetical protein